jgi:hypothetical protein
LGLTLAIRDIILPESPLVPHEGLPGTRRIAADIEDNVYIRSRDLRSRGSCLLVYNSDRALALVTRDTNVGNNCNNKLLGEV